MQDQRSRRYVPLGVVAGFSVLVLATGSAVAWWSWSSMTRRPSPTVSIEPSPAASQQPNQATPLAPAAAPPQTTAPAPQPNPIASPDEKVLQVYWLKGTGEDIELAATPVKLSSATNSTALLENAINKLLAGPSGTNMTTTIPRDTQVNQVDVREDGIHIDLSKSFTRGGGSSSMTARLAQILYTATSINPKASVWLSIDGKPLETLGGEGLMVEQPMTRTRFERDFSL